MPQLDRKFRIQAGEYIHPITLQRDMSNGMPNEYGIVKENWVDLFKTKAKINNNTDKEVYEQNVTEYTKVTKKFYFRTSRKFKLKSTDRLIYDSDIYSLDSISDLDDKKIITLVIATKIE